jgi:hypothetical protein
MSSALKLSGKRQGQSIGQEGLWKKRENVVLISRGYVMKISMKFDYYVDVMFSRSKIYT